MINYRIISDSIDFYEKLNYSRIESPWTVSPYVDNITKPKERPHLQLKHNDKCLVASGEQSFLYLYLKGFLPKGQFQTVTPCFRYELFDDTHTKYFIKNELIKTDKVTTEELHKVVDNAYDFFTQYLDKNYLDIVEINDYQLDLEYKGIELGSYGIRSCEFLDWIYGTGCAEPRLSTIIDKIKRGLV